MTSSLRDVIVMAAQKAKEARERPSKVTKERLSHIVEQEVIECGKIARHLCQHSGSREVLLKSAKKMAGQEVAMENTLSNLRQVERLMDRALDQANRIGRSIEQTLVVQEQIRTLIGQ